MVPRHLDVFHVVRHVFEAHVCDRDRESALRELMVTYRRRPWWGSKFCPLRPGRAARVNALPAWNDANVERATLIWFEIHFGARAFFCHVGKTAYRELAAAIAAGVEITPTLAELRRTSEQFHAWIQTPTRRPRGRPRGSLNRREARVFQLPSRQLPKAA